MDLTREQVASYLSSPFHCPFCGAAGDKIEWDEPIYHGERGPHCCNVCDFEWMEVIEVKVIGIDPTDPEEIEDMLGRQPRFLTMDNKED